jgi:hypothetical protein
VACKVKYDNAMLFREIWKLSTPIAGIATPTMYEHKSRFSSAKDLIRNRSAILGWNNMGPFSLCLYNSIGQNQEYKATDQTHQMFYNWLGTDSAISPNDIHFNLHYLSPL